MIPMEILIREMVFLFGAIGFLFGEMEPFSWPMGFFSG